VIGAAAVYAHEGFAMHHWWRRANFRIKHQFYLRVLPVVVTGTLAMGLLSWHMLNSRAVKFYAEHLCQQQDAQLAEMIHRFTLRAMSGAAGRETVTATDLATARAAAARSSARLLAAEGVCGAAIGPFMVAGGPSGDAAVGSSFRLCSQLDRPRNHEILRAWGNAHGKELRDPDHLVAAALQTGRLSPRLAALDRLHSLWLFPPLLLERAIVGPSELSGGSADSVEPRGWSLVDGVFSSGLLDGHDRASATRSVAVLPVLVRPRGELLQTAGAETDAAQTLLLLDLRELVVLRSQILEAESGVQILADRTGRVYLTTDPRIEVGVRLSAQPLRRPDGPLHHLQPAALNDAVEGISRGTGHTLCGPRLRPWLLAGSSRKDLPVILVTTLPVLGIHGNLPVYSAAVIAVMVLALLAAVYTITRVSRRLSDRIDSLSRNMEEVAHGDYSRRMMIADDDEMGRLIGFFNSMTGSLEQAHSDLNDRTARLRAALDNLKSLDKSKDDFLALISHEVRTPLTSIMAGVDFLRGTIPRLETDLRERLVQANVIETLEIIDSSGNRLSSFMNDAIQMAAVQATDRRLEFEPVCLAGLLDMALIGIHERAAEKKLSISNEMSQRDDFVLLCDRELMRLALEKLLDNAVRHNWSGGTLRIAEAAEIPGAGDVRTLVGAEQIKRLIDQPEFRNWQHEEILWRIVEVFNTGPAIPAHRQEALFGKFELVETIENHHRGLGLSLSIARTVIELHGGQIFLSSQDDVGNSFYLVVPTLHGSAASTTSVPQEIEAGESEPGESESSASESEVGEPVGLRHQESDGIGGTAGDEEVDLVAERTPVEVEL